MSGLAWPSDTIAITKDYMRASCIEAANNADAAGLRISSPDGRTYTFDQYTLKPAAAIPMLRQDPETSQTLRDVNGNWVKYEYDQYLRLVRIHANDGREITITRNGEGYISNISAHGRSWSYDYDGRYLETVHLPDGRFWKMESMESLNSTARSEVACPVPRDQMIQLTHPDGMRGEFTFRQVKHLQPSREAEPCEIDVQGHTEPVNWFNSWSIISKTIEGPNYPAATWTYNYPGGVDDGTLTPANRILPNDRLKWGEVTDPVGNRMRSYYVPGLGGSHVVHPDFKTGKRGGHSQPYEGLMKRSEYFAPDGTLVQTTENEYAVEEPVGTSWLWNEAQEKFTSPRPLIRTVTTVDGESYTTEHTYNSNKGSIDYSFSSPVESVASYVVVENGILTIGLKSQYMRFESTHIVNDVFKGFDGTNFSFQDESGSPFCIATPDAMMF